MFIFKIWTHAILKLNCLLNNRAIKPISTLLIPRIIVASKNNSTGCIHILKLMIRVGLGEISICINVILGLQIFLEELLGDKLKSLWLLPISDDGGGEGFMGELRYWFFMLETVAYSSWFHFCGNDLTFRMLSCVLGRISWMLLVGFFFV